MGIIRLKDGVITDMVAISAMAAIIVTVTAPVSVTATTMGEAAGLPMTADAMDAIMAAMAAMAAMVMAGAMAIIQIVAIPRQAMVDTAVELTGTHRCAGMALLVTVAGRAVRSMLRRLLCRSPFMVVGALATVM